MTFGMPFLLENRTIADAAELCAEYGLAFVELNLNFPACQTDCLDVQLLYELKRRYGIFFTLHLEEDCDPFSFNRSVRKAWLDSMRNTLLLAQAIEAPIVNMHMPKGIYITLPEEKVYLYQRYQEEYRQAVEQLKRMCCETLQNSQTRIAIENTNGFAPHEQRAIAALLESSAFGLTLDIGHSHVVGDVDIPFYRQYEHKLIHMHGHDAVGGKNHLALGEGEIDLTQRIAWAERCGARVVLETKTVRALKYSISWLSRAEK